MTTPNLSDALRRYLAALSSRNPTDLSLAPHCRYSENNVELAIGDGCWNTVSQLTEPYLVIPDIDANCIVAFTTITEGPDTSGMAIRLGLNNTGELEHIEVIIARQADEGFKFPNPQFYQKAIFDELIDEHERANRDQLSAAAHGYFDTLQQNDGTLYVDFHTECDRVENGVQTTRTPDEALGKRLHQATLGCREQFELGYYRYDDRLRGRRIVACNSERGIVVACGFIDHCGKVTDYSLSDGTPASSPIRRPHSYYLMEAFKVERGAIRQVEAIFITVPYHMKSPW